MNLIENYPEISSERQIIGIRKSNIFRHTHSHSHTILLFKKIRNVVRDLCIRTLI